MKAFKDLFPDISGAEYAMAAAVVIALVVIAAGANFALDFQYRRVATPTASRAIAGPASEPDARISALGHYVESLIATA